MVECGMARVWLAAVVALWLTGCGGDGDQSAHVGELVDPSSAQAADPQPLEVSSLTSCSLDIDCASGTYCFQGYCAKQCDEQSVCSDGAECDSRGRCLADAPDVVAEIRLVGAAESVFHVQPGEQRVDVELELSDAPGATPISYVLERNDGPQATGLVRQMNVEGTTARFSLPVGDASPDAETPSPVRVRMISSVGSLTLALVPEMPAGALYRGMVRMDTFGAHGMPLEFAVVTEPEGASLSSAQAAHMVLWLDEASAFSPGRGEQAPEHITAELVYDDFTQAYVATFDGAFDLTQGAAIRHARADQVERKLRFELSATSEGELTGSVRDTWLGLYDERSIEGVRAPARVTYRGELRAQSVDEAPALASLDFDARLPDAETQLTSAPALDDCGSVDFSTAEIELDGQSYSCAGIDSVVAFEAASADARAQCAVAVAQTGLAGETVAKQIRAFVDGEASGGESFAEFMSRCAQGVDGTCQPAPEVVCGRQLTAYAYRDRDVSSEHLSLVLRTYVEATREAFLGREFGALQSDTETRLEWLKTTDYPAIVTAAVRDRSEELLADWQRDVLDVHFEVLRGQFDVAGLSVLAREAQGQEVLEARGVLLMDMNQSFRTAMEALTLAAQRWDALFVEPAKRREYAAYVALRTRDLYLAAGVLQNLNQATGAGYLSASLGGGFSGLQRELDRLSSDFNQLIYARDAEAVVSTSVDPTVSNLTLLAEMESDARGAIDSALQTVTSVVAQDQAEALGESELRNRLNNGIDDLKRELISMCGMPRGCSAVDVLDDEACRPRVADGQCGFIFERGEDDFALADMADLATSEAGSRFLAVLEAAKNINVAASEVVELRKRAKFAHAQTSAFARNLARRAGLRRENLEQMREAFAALKTSRRAEIGRLAASIAERVRLRQKIVDDGKVAAEQWNSMRVGANQAQMDAELEALNLENFAAVLNNNADAALLFTEAGVEFIPDDPDDIFTGSSAIRGAIRMIGAASATALNTTATGLQNYSRARALAAEQDARVRSAELEYQQELSDLGTEADINEIAELRDKVAQIQSMGEAERAQINHALQLALQENEYHLAMLDEAQQLSDRRAAIRQDMTRLSGLLLRVQQARLQYLQRMSDYAVLVQRAQLLDAKLDELVRQRANINLIVGSPTAVFVRANRITQAENKLERAKDLLMDWLVGLEYYAVRPFMDQRIQILLARNPYQLEAIADELERLQAACGGSVNQFSAELSVREDLLGITEAQVEMEGQSVAPEQLFRDLLADGYVPIDKRVRYSTDQNVGELLSSSSDILAATFQIDSSDFANLGSTCNAKVESVDIQLVGPVGQALPTVSLLYDGTAELRSCQPGIDAYVAQFGADSTSFGSITYVRSKGRSISPVAGINEFIAESANTTLSGLPLSSQYTILIDRSVGENKQIDWGSLQDIRLRVNYSYQDVFPEGQCQ